MNVSKSGLVEELLLAERSSLNFVMIDAEYDDNVSVLDVNMVI